MLNYYLYNNVTENLVLFADNCTGQNKNNELLHYLLWRVMRKMNKSIKLNFLLTGHTKFSPDRNFGIVKSKFSKSIVNCQEDFIEVINASSPNKFNIAVPTKDPKTKVRNGFWAEWDKYLQQYFKAVPNLLKYHHFKFYEDGSIKAKLFANSEEVELQEATLMHAEVLPLKFIEPEGISEQRARYLYKEIRPLCYKESSKDLVAPQPKLPDTKSNRKEANNKQVQEPKISRVRKNKKSSKNGIDKKPDTSKGKRNKESSKDVLGEKPKTSRGKKIKNHWKMSSTKNQKHQGEKEIKNHRKKSSRKNQTLTGEKFQRQRSLRLFKNVCIMME